MTSVKRVADIMAVHVLEKDVRLSRSRLWDFERAYYERQGLRAWGAGEVPHAITSNPMIAAGYAEVIVAFLRDCDAAGRLDRSRRVHVLELGSGSGRLGYALLRHLRPLLAATPLGDLPVTVVLSDFDGANLEQLAAAPRFACDVADGWLDFAIVDAADPAEVRTWRGEVLAKAPLVVIANYVFDSLPADVYAVSQGAIHEVDLTILADTPALDRHEPNALGHLRLEWKAVEEPAPPTGSSAIDSVLARYAEVLDATMVTIPTTALSCLERLSAAASAPVLALVGDKGFSHLRDLAGQGPPMFAPDAGSFSLMVNFDAVAQIVRAGGGTALLPPHQAQHLVVAAYVLDGLEVPQTAHCYAPLAEGGTDDIFAARKAQLAGGTPTLQQALSRLRIDRFDVLTFLELFPTLHRLAADAEGAAKTDVALAVRRVHDGWFPIGEAADVSLCLGALLSRIGHHREALEMYAESAELRGPSAASSFASAVAFHALRDLDRSLKEVRDALALDPVNDAARRLALELEAEIWAQRRRSGRLTTPPTTPLLDGLVAFLRADGWPVNRPPGPVPTVETRCAGATAEWQCTGRTFEAKGQVDFDSTVPIEVPQDMGPAIGLLLIAANWTLPTGSFALNPATGQVRLRTSLVACGPTLDPPAAKTLVHDNVLTVERCLPALVAVATGTLDLAQALEQLEH